jgi:hypothetical protein
MKSALIKSGRHRSTISLPQLYINKKHLSYSIKFLDSCEYKLPDKNKWDINKLFGLSFGLHHNNSARFGWRWNEEKLAIEVLAYVYIDGKRMREWDSDIHIADIKLNSTILIDLSVSDDSYSFKIIDGDNTYIREISHGGVTFWGYKLFPYFGGNLTAPHNIIIEYRELY